MGNFRTRTISYKPRMTGYEAMELLPLTIKAALWDGVISWDAYGVLREYRRLVKIFGEKHAIKECVRWLKDADANEAKRPWGKKVPSPCSTLNIPVMRSYDAHYANLKFNIGS